MPTSRLQVTEFTLKPVAVNRGKLARLSFVPVLPMFLANCFFWKFLGRRGGARIRPRRGHRLDRAARANPQRARRSWPRPMPSRRSAAILPASRPGLHRVRCRGRVEALDAVTAPHKRTAHRKTTTPRKLRIQAAPAACTGRCRIRAPSDAPNSTALWKLCHQRREFVEKSPV
jgi:hypothetical protein